MSLGKVLVAIVAGLVLGQFFRSLTGIPSSGILGIGVSIVACFWYARWRPVWAERRVERQAAKEQRRREEAAAAAKRKQEADWSKDQARSDNEALTERLRATVNELVNHATLLAPDSDNSDVVQAMHTTVNDLANWSRDLKPHHFDDKLLRHDSRMVLAMIGRAGIRDDLLVGRLRMALGMEEPLSVTASTITGAALPPDVVRLHPPGRAAG